MRPRAAFLAFLSLPLGLAILPQILTPPTDAALQTRPSATLAEGVPTGASSSVSEATRVTVLEAYGKLPLSLEPNQGQTDARVKFLSRGRGYVLFLTSEEAVLALRPPRRASPGEHQGAGEVKATEKAGWKPAVRKEAPAEDSDSHASAVLRMRLVGANPQSEVAGLDPLPGESHYFIGNDPRQWRTNVPHYARVLYRDAYPGIDLVYHGQQGQLEYDFVVRPGADAKAITTRFAGAEKLERDAGGDLILHTTAGPVRQHRPRVYQEEEGVRKEIAGEYVVKGEDEVGFEVGEYDRSRTLIIDPVLSYSTYLGGSDTEQGLGIAVDGTGAAYVTGFTDDTDFPTTPGAFDTSSNGGEEAFVTKLNATGTALVYSTYLGGNGGFDQGASIAVDATGAAYVTGITDAPDFPTTLGAFDTAISAGGFDGFVTKLNGAGSALVYSTYLGGSNESQGRGIAVDATGAAYVTGITDSGDFPTTSGAFDTTSNGFRDAFVTKLNAPGTALVYSTFLGGSITNLGESIAVDGTGAAYVTGATGGDFPTTLGAVDTTFNGGTLDAFVTKLNATGTALVHSTYLGGSGQDFGLEIAVDATGAAYVTGQTTSPDFPTTPLAFDITLNGGFDGFVTKLNGAGSALVYSTYLGGSANDAGIGIAVDAAGNAYVAGATDSMNFPTTVDAFQAVHQGIRDAFLTRLNAAGSSPDFSTFLGGSGFDDARSIALDGLGGAYLTGVTNSVNFPTTPGAFDRTTTGVFLDAYVTKFGGFEVCPPDNDDGDDDDFDNDCERDDEDADDDNDGEADEADNDDDNDGASDANDDDDDNDGILDEFDLESTRELQTSFSSAVPGGGQMEQFMEADANTLALIAVVTATTANLTQPLRVEMYDPTGVRVASSLPTPAGAVAAAAVVLPGRYTVRVLNPSGAGVSYKAAYISRQNWR